MYIRNFLLFLILLFSFAPIANSEVKEFVREYTYNASDSDSKISSRNTAMQQLQTLLIQEVGVQVQASFNSSETLSGDDFSRNVQANYETFAQALTKTKILEEDWNGEQFYLKAEVTIDTDNLIEKIRLLHVGPDNNVATDPCEAISNEVYGLLEEVRTEKVVDKILEKSKSYGFDDDCYRWQYGILRSFRVALTDSDAYRKHAFNSIKETDSAFLAGKLLIEVLRYALAIKPLSGDEWDIVVNTAIHGKSNVVTSLIGLLVTHTRPEIPAENEKQKRIDERKQSSESLERQLFQLIRLAENREFTSPNAITESKIIFFSFKRTLNSQNRVAHRLFNDYFNFMSVRDKQNVARNIATWAENNWYNDPYFLVTNYLFEVEVNSRVAKALFPVLERIEKEAVEDEEKKQHFKKFIRSSGSEVLQIVNLARTQEHVKNIWKIKYDLTKQVPCDVVQCGEMLFSKEKRVREQAADYLIAYQERAASAEHLVLKKLNRFMVLNKLANDPILIPKLFKILDNIETKKQVAFELMIWALNDLNRPVHQQAYESIVKSDIRALPVIEREFSKMTPLSQRRTIEAVGKWKLYPHETLAFLKKLKPKYPKVQFAVEDAQMAINKIIQ